METAVIFAALFVDAALSARSHSPRNWCAG